MQIVEKSIHIDDGQRKHSFIFNLIVNDHISEFIIKEKNFYEGKFLKFLSTFLNRNDLVVDVGANIGNHSVFFAGIDDVQVVAFEPIPALARIAKRNVDSNLLGGKVKVVPKGLGRKKSSKIFYLPSHNNYGMYSSLKCNAVEKTRVNIVSLDQYLKRNKFACVVKLIKIDVEGMELDVLKGAKSTLQVFRPILAIEITSTTRLLRIRDFLKPYDYKCLGVFNETPTYVFKS